MKKSFVLILLVMLLLTLTACEKNIDNPAPTIAPNEKNTVTLYIPKTLTIKAAEGVDGGVIGPVEYVFEEGWQTKEVFSITEPSCSHSFSTDGINNVKLTTYTCTVSDKKVVREIDGGFTQEYRYDENGLCVYTKTEMDGQITEIQYSYDDKGRYLNAQGKTYVGEREPIIQNQTFVSEETAEGSRVTYKGEGYQISYIYNKDNKLVGLIQTLADGNEVRTVYTLNEYGKIQSSEFYLNGKLAATATYTYEAVEVSPEKAAQLPQHQ